MTVLLLNHDLPRMTGDLKSHNARIALMHKHIYQWGRWQFYFRETTREHAFRYVGINIGGRRLSVGVSETLLDLLIKPYGVTVADLSTEALELLLKSEFMLPEPMILEGLVSPLEELYRWEMVDYASNEPLGGVVSVGATEAMDLPVVLSLFQTWLVGYRPHPLEQLPIPLPLVATSFEVPAEDLATLEVGDILLVG